MPFLRRRGNNMASDADMRHHHASPTSDDRGGEDGLDLPPNQPSQQAQQAQQSQQVIDDTRPLSQQDSREAVTSRPTTPLAQPSSGKHRRFSVLRFRNASDTQLSLRVKQQQQQQQQQAEKLPPVPRTPAIVTTAPGNDATQGPKKMSSRMGLAARFRRSADVPRDEQLPPLPHPPSHPHKQTSPSHLPPPSLPLLPQQQELEHELDLELEQEPGTKQQLEQASHQQPSTDAPIPQQMSTPKSSADQARRTSFYVSDDPHSPRPSTQATIASTGTGPGISTNRPSESSRSDVSSTDRVSQSSPNASSKKSRPTTPFFKLRRSRKPPEPLFPLAHLQQTGNTSGLGSSTSLAVEGTPRPASAHSAGTPRGLDGYHGHGPHPSTANALFASSGDLSGHSSPTQANLPRGRSSTMSSLGRNSTDDHLTGGPPARTASSIGRKSFGDLLGLSRLRQTPDLSRQGMLTPATPGSVTSKSCSLQLPRESVALPERLDEESPAKYIARIEGVVSRSVIAAALSKGTDAFSSAALRSYMRTYSFFGDPMDMAIRKLLMEAELPKETQQIDRCLQAFANRYHECNPGIYSSPDNAYTTAFSLLILHTDAWNRSNRHKMQKPDYVKILNGQGISNAILEYFYDNICYAQFIKVEDDPDSGGERVPGGMGNKSKRKNLLPGASADPVKRAAREPLDPYTLILEGNLDNLRPNLKDIITLEDQYSYLGSAKSLNLKDLQKTFFRTGVLQIVSARSRPDAFLSDKSAGNPDDTHPGIVDIKVTKVGLLWRKDTKKRKTRSPWQEWGAILTGAQLYFFRNTSWIKSLMHQYESHIKAGHDGIPVTFKPPLDNFKPDHLMSTEGAVALVDTSYKKHKNAFIFVSPRRDEPEEVLLADDEHELNDWLAKLNYAAAFRTSGVRMRGVVGGSYDGQGRRGFRRLDSSDASQLIQTPTGPVSVARSRIDHKMAEDIQSARREVMRKKIAEADRKTEELRKALDELLRNARHLQILAPVQPKTREDLISAAARIYVQLRSTQKEIWREKCHRDILALDLEEDGSSVSETNEALNQKESVIDAAVGPGSGSGSKPQRLSVMTRSDSRTNLERILELGFQKPMSNRLSSISIPVDVANDLKRMPTSPARRPSSAPRPQNESLDSFIGGGDAMNSVPWRGSASTHAAAYSMPSPSPSTRQAPQDMHSDAENIPSPGPSPHDETHDDEDAQERQLLKQVGLLQVRTGRDPTDKPITSTSGEALEQMLPGERDRFERSKIRRSLQRTLRESAGHLSHHRSKKGRESNATASTEDSARDSTLERGTGSFTVHGKKASVINLGSELQVMSNEEQIMARKQQQQQPTTTHHSGEQLTSPVQGGPQDDDLNSKAETPTDAQGYFQRRESAASVSTATARSFRDLHRKYSSVQAARSVSAAGRLAIPADGEAAESPSDGPGSPLPPMPSDEADDDEDVKVEPEDKVEKEAEEGGKEEPAAN